MPVFCLSVGLMLGALKYLFCRGRIEVRWLEDRFTTQENTAVRMYVGLDIQLGHEEALDGCGFEHDAI